MDNGLTRIFDLIKRERIYQDQKWGTVKENPHTIEEWTNIIEDETYEAGVEYHKSDDMEKFLAEMIQVAAVVCACLEQYEDVLADYKGR